MQKQVCVIGVDPGVCTGWAVLKCEMNSGGYSFVESGETVTRSPRAVEELLLKLFSICEKELSLRPGEREYEGRIRFCIEDFRLHGGGAGNTHWDGLSPVWVRSWIEMCLWMWEWEGCTVGVRGWKGVFYQMPGDRNVVHKEEVAIARVKGGGGHAMEAMKHAVLGVRKGVHR